MISSFPAIFLCPEIAHSHRFGNVASLWISYASIGCVSNWINTCDNLYRKGWIGPIWCCLCKCSLESVTHIFIECRYTRWVIMFLSSTLQRPLSWNGSSYLQILDLWIWNEGLLAHLPLFFCWQMWLARNRCIFEDSRPDPEHTVYYILEQLKLHPSVTHNRRKIRNIGLAPSIIYPTGYFDGATAKLIGGIGVHLLISHDHDFHLNTGIGSSAKTRA